ncbi:MAG: DUF308 domain-containing protein, partial [Culicoidibacterales bacterium]
MPTSGLSKRELGTDIFTFFTNLFLIMSGIFLILLPDFSLGFVIFILLLSAMSNGVTFLVKGIFYPVTKRLLMILTGVAYLVMSGLIISVPNLSTFLVTVLLGFWFFIDGLIKMIIGNQYRISGEKNWWAMLASALTSFIFVGLFIFSSQMSTQLFLFL